MGIGIGAAGQGSGDEYPLFLASTELGTFISYIGFITLKGKRGKVNLEWLFYHYWMIIQLRFRY